MVELRKRKAPAAPVPAPPAKKASSVKSVTTKAKEILSGKSNSAASGAASKGKVAAGSTIALEGFGGEIETNDGAKTTLKSLVDESKAGVVLFTYPKASTPGCTTQACLFRDDYANLTSTGLAIYGLSSDSPKANTTFKTKQNLPYTLLCDPALTLISAIGMKKAPKGTTRGVFVVNKEGKVLAVEAGGPAATVEVVRKLIAGGSSTETGAAAKDEENAAGESKAEKAVEEGNANAQDAGEPAGESNGAIPSAESKDQADVAAEVADSAAKLDAEK